LSWLFAFLNSQKQNHKKRAKEKKKALGRPSLKNIVQETGSMGACLERPIFSKNNSIIKKQEDR
jgi:hypothetical protein